MSFILQASRHKPTGLFSMDSASPIQDYSPYARVATITGTPGRYPGMVKGSKYAQVFGSSNTVKFDVPVFQQGFEALPFSIWATFRTTKNTAASDQQVIGHTGHFDGLSINGTVVSFSTKYLTQGEAKCSFDIQTARAVNAVGVHTKNKNSLFIDGALVAEVTITPEQLADSYIATNGSLYSGQTASSREVALGAVGFFAHPLSFESISMIHKDSRDVMDGPAVVVASGGEPVDMSKDASSMFLNRTLSTDEDFLSGTFLGASLTNGTIVPQFSGDTSRAGAWTIAIPLGFANTTSVHGINLDWDAEGVVVETSLTGTSWTVATRGVNISIVPPGFNPTSQTLLIRVSFAGGILNDESFLDSISITGVRSSTTPGQGGQPVVLNSAYQQNQYKVIEQREQWGTEIGSGGSVTLTPDTSTDPLNPRTIELWIKRTTTTIPTFSHSGTFYQNGVASTSTVPIGQWTLLHIVTASPVTANFVITGQSQIGQIGLYAAALSAADITAVSERYYGANKLGVVDASVVSFTQSATSALIYAHDWAIMGAG